MSGWLASVRSLAEVRLLLTTPFSLPDIVDLKEPRQGVLGALPVTTVCEAVKLLKEHCGTSATIGDLPPEPAQIRRAVEKMAATGVDYVKIGLLTTVENQFFDCLTALQPLANRGISLVGVMFADQHLDYSWIPLMGRVGFKGVMLDTGVKEEGSLLSYLSLTALAEFVEIAHNAGLVSGLAGSLSIAEIPLLLPLNPDYLGFRSALCRAGRREFNLDLQAVLKLRQILNEEGLEAVPGEVRKINVTVAQLKKDSFESY